MKLQINFDKVSDNEFEGYVAPDENEEHLLQALGLGKKDKAEIWGMFGHGLYSIFIVKPGGTHLKLEESRIDMEDFERKLLRALSLKD